VRKALSSIPTKNLAVLFLDDVHWADSASLALLHYISRTLASERLLVLATYRSEDLKEDEKGRPHPLLETLRLVRRDNLFREIKLSGLSPTDVALLAENMIGGNVQSALAQIPFTPRASRKTTTPSSIRGFFIAISIAKNYYNR
jgi:predicted ATPase